MVVVGGYVRSRCARYTMRRGAPAPLVLGRGRGARKEEEGGWSPRGGKEEKESAPSPKKKGTFQKKTVGCVCVKGERMKERCGGARGARTIVSLSISLPVRS